MRSRHPAVRLIMMTLVPILIGLSMPVAHAGCRDDVPAAQRIGHGQFCFLGICLYDAELWAAHSPDAFDTPFALSLTYRHSVKGARFVKAGMSEIERLAPEPLPATTLGRWREDMTHAFGDVVPGDVLCGVYLPGHGARFYTNGQLSAAIDDPAFARAFFDIWFDPRTRAPSLRAKLLGKTDD